MRVVLLFLLLLLSSCATTKKMSGISTEIYVKCIANNGEQAVFESNNPNYSQIVVKDKVSKYKVGRSYVLILRKK